MLQTSSSGLVFRPLNATALAETERKGRSVFSTFPFTRRRIVGTTVPGSCNSRHKRLLPGPPGQFRSEKKTARTKLVEKSRYLREKTVNTVLRH